jgi:hypothetical protein
MGGRHRTVIGVAMTLTLLATAAGATTTARSPVVGADFRISGINATGTEQDAALAWNGTSDEFLVVWDDTRGQSENSDIYGRRVSGTGAPVGEDFVISGPGADWYDHQPAVAWNGSEYLVVWSDARDYNTRKTDIYARRVSAAGVPQGADFRICGAEAVWADLNPEVAWNGSRYLVVWEDRRNWQTRGADIYAQRVSAAGALVGGNTRLSGPEATDYEMDPAVAWNPAAGQYLVVWEDQRSKATRGIDIYAQRVTAAGALLGGPLRVGGSAANISEFDPVVVANDVAGEYLVVWEDHRNEETRNADIYARRVSANGVPQGADTRITGQGGILFDGQAAAAWSGTDYLVAWLDFRAEPKRGGDTWARRVSAAGKPVGAEFRICGPGATANDGWPAVAWSSTAGRFLVAFADGRDTLRRFDIRGRWVAGP